jgi:hypothetical protein
MRPRARGREKKKREKKKKKRFSPHAVQEIYTSSQARTAREKERRKENEKRILITPLQ